MVRKDIRHFADGSAKTWVRVVEGYRPAPGKAPKQRTIKSFGYLEDQDDPEAFMELVRSFDEEQRRDAPIQIEVSSNVRMYGTENRKQNYGYKYLEAIYNRLEIDAYIRRYEKNSKFRGTYSLGNIFKFLVLYRILAPDSKRATCQISNQPYGFETNFTLKDVYRALDSFADFSIDLQKHMNERVKRLVGREMNYAFYDVTNYYFEIDEPDEDGLRRRGVSKEHRVDPIVQMGLFLDEKGLPVSMSLFPGNTSETLTLQPMMQEIKRSYGLGRLVVVADKGLNSSTNIDKIINNGDGYVVSQILRGTKGKRYHEALFDTESYTISADGSYKYKLYNEEYIGRDAEGEPVRRKRQVLIYWSRAEAEMMKAKRKEKLQRAESATRNPVYTIAKGKQAYTKEIIIDATTGQELDDTARQVSVDYEKAEQDAAYDGYFCILTSEMDYSAQKIREVYGGLWKIEESFRVMKSDLDARPVYVSTEKHIQAHFLICFTALLVVRMLQYEMGGNAISSERIARALNAANCRMLRGGILQLDDVGGALAFESRTAKNGAQEETLVYSGEDEIAQDYRRIQQVFGVDFDYVYPKQEVFSRFLSKLV
ncbi:MAG: IS1634 family transposase [Clostridia bacterium]|nr:IS1634 family transposase [Clostridia bacterium]